MTEPFLSSIQARVPLAQPSSGKSTYHLVLDLKGSEIAYRVGDSIGIYPQNSEDEVEEILKLVPRADALVVDRKGHRMEWGHFLSHKANLATLNRKLVERVAESTGDAKLKELLSSEDRSPLKSYLAGFHVADFLEAYRELSWSSEELAPLLLPLLPRFYSVASSQAVVGDEVHLLVADLHYTLRGKERRGVASYHLCHAWETHRPLVSLFHQPAHSFFLTDQLEAPIIMIGPGTGVAPFRGFMQERVRLGASKRNWLFFGERHEADHFFYRSEWEKFAQEGFLKLSTAFSRDQTHKVYVQHRMVEEGRELFKWIQEGAYLYVCGDASRMAKDVEDALLEIIQVHGQMGEAASHAFLKDLRAKKRYQRDVY